MVKIHSGATNKFNHNIVQQPKTEKANKSSKTQPPPNLTRSAGNTKPSDVAAIRNGLGESLLRLKLEKKLIGFIAANNTKKNEVKVTYVPGDDNRHKTSKYDNLPFPNHIKNSPDRYRAVNPKRAGEGVKGEKLLYFPLKDGKDKNGNVVKHIMVDGNGKDRGAITKSSVKLNYAQVKKINGEDYYYAFDTKIIDKNSNKEIGASGWVKASAIENGNAPKYTEKNIKNAQPRAVSEVHGKHKDYQQYVVQNVHPKELTGKDGKPKYGFIKDGKFVSYKVLQGKTKDENFSASDYLRRTGNVINLGFNAAGLSNDTFKVDAKDKAGKPLPVVFHRAPTSIKSATVDIDIYHPKDKNHLGQKPVGKMRFVYGYVEIPATKQGLTVIPATKRWGWMALGALKQKDKV